MSGAKTKTVGSKLDEALRKADDAVKELKDMGENAKVALSDDFSALRDAIIDTNVAHRIGEAKDKIVEATGNSVEKVKEAGVKVDENIHEQPYYYVAGAAVIGLLLGVLIARKG
ncbi:MAG: DUF883 family protein [Victivallales bacterium]|nr:DUF883 family protein [Victivallales bacterium]